MTAADSITINEIEPLLLNGRDAAKLLGVSARTWRRFDSTGLVPQALRLGRSKRWAVDELRLWVAAGCPSRAQWEHIKRNDNREQIAA